MTDLVDRLNVALLFADEIARLRAENEALRTALVQQRAFVLHWTDDVNGGLKPTLGSLRGALELIDRAANEARQ